MERQLALDRNRKGRGRQTAAAAIKMDPGQVSTVRYQRSYDLHLSGHAQHLVVFTQLRSCVGLDLAVLFESASFFPKVLARSASFGSFTVLARTSTY